MTTTAKSVWCSVCDTPHADPGNCPGELTASGPEERGWKAHVNTGTRVDTFGVLLARCGRTWRARIVTYPRSLWTVPGTRATMKFAGRSDEEAEQRAIAFIRKVCAARGYSICGSDLVSPGVCIVEPPKRKVHRMPVRYGASSISTFVGVTLNVSAEGMFISTDLPLQAGEPISVELGLDGRPVRLEGLVVWTRVAPQPGRPRGMGIRLVDPPGLYPAFVLALV